MISDIVQFLTIQAPIIALAATLILLSVFVAMSIKSRANMIANGLLVAILLAYYAADLSRILRKIDKNYVPTWLVDGVSNGLQAYNKALISVLPNFDGFVLSGVRFLQLSPSEQYTANIYPIALLVLGLAARWIVNRYVKNTKIRVATTRYWLRATVTAVFSVIICQLVRLDSASVAAILGTLALIYWIGGVNIASDAVNALLAIGRLIVVGVRILVIYTALIGVRSLKFGRNIGRRIRQLYTRAIASPTSSLNSSLTKKLKSIEGAALKSLKEARMEVSRPKS